ncbi:MAG: glycoside hydrolase family 127 protein [Prevotella sp.]|nr:glycoside hydrolase family 127 protein [Prevotella sp.]
MNKTWILMAIAAWSTTAQAADGAKQAIISEVPFTQVHLNDVFWTPRIETNRTISIPSAFRECEANGRFDNFALAATRLGHAHYDVKEHRGDFSFDDTDPYKVIEGASYSLAVNYDKQLDHYLDSVINIIALAQEPDGYLTTCVTNNCTRLSGWWGTHKWEKINSHELYNSGHLIESAVAHYRATGKKTFLNVAIKNADLVCRTFGPNEGQIHRPGGHPIIEMALCKLYKVTGNRKYLEGARYFVEETGRCTDGHHPSEYSQDHKPILQQDEIVGHAVRAGYLYSGVADVAALTGDKAYQEALERIWQNMSSKKLFITGGIGSRAQGEGFGPNYELNSHTAYCETCAAIANVYWNYRMFLATGQSKYMDVVERALYNNVLSGVSLSGDRFFYDNPLESDGEHERQRWFGCACCPGNVTRFIASVPGYMYAQQGKDIYVNLYAQGKARIGNIELEQTTEYPWDGNVSIKVAKGSGRFAIKLRIPSWLKASPTNNNLYAYADKAANYSVSVNGQPLYPENIDYITIERQWKKGDVISLSLPMDVRRIVANDNAEDLRQKVALERGPIVFCIEAADQPDHTIFDKYLLATNQLSQHFESSLLGGVIVLDGQAMKVGQNGEVSQVKLRAIPYSTWNNRGPQAMEVWIASMPTAAVPMPLETIASRAQTFSNRGPIQNDAPETALTDSWAGGVNDLWEPRRSSDTSKPYHYWWLKRGTKESISYKFDKEYEVSNVQVYWLDFDHYDGDFRTPESWVLYYKAQDGQWREVEQHSPFTVSKDCYNSVDFKPVTTQELKIVAQLRKGQSGGVLEWKVNHGQPLSADGKKHVGYFEGYEIR